MKLGVVIDGEDNFIREILADWSLRYDVNIFSYEDHEYPFMSGRINNFRRRHALSNFLHKHDVIFFEWAGPLLIEASQLNIKANLIARLHSWELFEFAPYIRWQTVQKIVLVGKAMERRFCELYPAQAAKINVVSNYVRADKFRPDYKNNGKVIGMLGYIIPIKRVCEVILAIYELRGKGFDFTLRLGGMPRDKGADDLRYYASVKYLVNKLGMESYVKFDGYIEHPEIFLNQLDIFISNSYWEGQHVALVEAMASGCYCLGFNWDGIEDILPAENIYFTNTELIDKINKYWALSDEDKLKQRILLRNIACQKYDSNLVIQTLRKIIEGES